MKDPSEWPVIKRDGRSYSFLDCVCDGTCVGRNCVYCAFELPEGGCPGNEED